MSAAPTSVSANGRIFAPQRGGFAEAPPATATNQDMVEYLDVEQAPSHQGAASKDEICVRRGCAPRWVIVRKDQRHGPRPNGISEEITGLGSGSVARSEGHKATGPN